MAKEVTTMPPCWDPADQMPPGRPFEAYHMTSAIVQPRVMHSHEFYEIYFFLRGDIRIVTEDVDVCPRRGDVLLFPPHCMHRNQHLNADEPYERFYLYVTRDFLRSIHGAGYDLTRELDALLQESGCRFHLSDAALEELLQLTDEIIRASQLQSPPEQMLNSCRMGMLLIRTLTLLQESRTPARSDPPGRMSALLRYLNDHLTEPLSLDDLADAFYLSKFALLRAFREYIGMSVHQYLLAKRILLAKELLAQGLKPCEVSGQCGFSDYTGFYRAFRQRTGVSPAQYGRENRS